MKSLVARLLRGFSLKKQGKAQKRLVAEEEILIAKGREQFQKLLDKGLSIPIATL
jgi:hypothetical protein